MFSRHCRAEYLLSQLGRALPSKQTVTHMTHPINTQHMYSYYTVAFRGHEYYERYERLDAAGACKLWPPLCCGTLGSIRETGQICAQSFVTVFTLATVSTVWCCVYLCSSLSAPRARDCLCKVTVLIWAGNSMPAATADLLPLKLCHTSRSEEYSSLLTPCEVLRIYLHI